MLEIANFRLLLHSSSLPLCIFSRARRLAVQQTSLSRFVWLSSYRITPKLLISYRKDCRVLREIFTRDTDMASEEGNTTGFNKRRAEGTDNDKSRVCPLKSRKLNPINTICFLQILGTGMDTQDTSPSVLLFFDRQRFIFNAGEGLQRFCAEHKIKLSKIDHVLLTRVCSETAGGLPGLLLTLAGLGDTGMSVKISGPSDLGILVNAMKSFIPKAAMIHTISFGPPNGPDGITVAHLNNFSDPREVLNDELVNISAILLLPCFLEGSHCTESDKTVIKPGDISVVYICELPEIKGTFYPEKAAALGLKPGPKYRELQFGHSVKSDKFDLTVHPSDVMEPSIPGPVVILVDCPTEYHLRGLLSIQSLNRYYTDSTEYVKAANCIVHLSPRSVTSLPDYDIWMKKFGEAQHVLAGHEVKNIVVPILQSSARITTQLSYLCPQFFPASWLLHHTNESGAKNTLSSEGTVARPCRTIPAENLLKFHLRPYKNFGIDRSSVPTPTNLPEVTEQLIMDNPDIVEAARKLNQIGSNAGGANGNANLVQDGDSAEQLCLDGEHLPSCLEDVSREDMEIILLGTGSSHPSKYRNVSSIYINLFSQGSLLLDCGEGTLGQLRRRFGIKGADDAVKSLRIIWISHIHADHHTGLARILSLRQKLLEGENLHERLLVIGPEPLRRFLNAYQILEDLAMQFIDCRKTTELNVDYGSNGPCSPTLQWLNEVLHDAGLETLNSFPVVHCPNAFGVVITASRRVNTKGKVIPGWKVVYSGDTRPCTQLIAAAQGATVLIHEATLEEGMEEEAIEKNHSTTKEAVEVGASSGAYRVILTHFSQRYPKIPVFGSSYMDRTCVGFDLMSINLADLPMLPMIMPSLKLLFRDDMGVDDLDGGEDVMAVDLMM